MSFLQIEFYKLKVKKLGAGIKIKLVEKYLDQSRMTYGGVG